MDTGKIAIGQLEKASGKVRKGPLMLAHARSSAEDDAQNARFACLRNSCN